MKEIEHNLEDADQQLQKAESLAQGNFKFFRRVLNFVVFLARRTIQVKHMDSI